MDNGIYIALSRQTGLFRDMEETANNIANVNTTGFQSGHVMFDSYLVPGDSAGRKMAYANDVSNYRNTQAGAMNATGNPLDVAIQGDGYFMVETALGQRYTRAGNFQIDGGGTLTTAEGYAVLDNNGQRITFPEDARDIKIGEGGNINVNGQEFATLGVFKFENQQMLERSGDRLLRSEVPGAPADTARVAQGMLENSNVQPVLELTHMIDVTRQVANTAKYVEVMYDLQRKTGSTWTQQS